MGRMIGRDAHAGVLLSWGRNEYGSLGLGNTTFMTKPEPVTFFLEKGLQVKDMNCGGWHSTAITSCVLNNLNQ